MCAQFGIALCKHISPSNKNVQTVELYSVFRKDVVNSVLLVAVFSKILTNKQVKSIEGKGFSVYNKKQL